MDRMETSSLARVPFRESEKTTFTDPSNSGLLLEKKRRTAQADGGALRQGLQHRVRRALLKNTMREAELSMGMGARVRPKRPFPSHR
jgi:hypothetical protein